MIYSFDIFDTLITRKTATPKGIFAIMQRRLMQDREFSSISLYIRENFYELRIYAEEIARYSILSQEGKEEVTLEEIYHGFLLTGSVTEQEVLQLQQLELEVEYECSIPIKENIEKLKKRYSSLNTIVLISDMYLDADTIRQLLLKHDSIFKEMKIFVSSEYRKQKSSGALFACVKNKEKLEEKKWIHIGDNTVADKSGAEKAGICSELYQYPSFFEFEKQVLDALEADMDVQLMIGTSRNLRIGCKKGLAYHMGTSFGGNLIFPYMQWVISESLKKGIQHLYFIARDGFILKQVADLIIEKYLYPIKTSYIYGSRKAWRMACFSKEKTNIEQVIYFTNMEEQNSIDKIAKIFQLLPEEIEEFIEEKRQDYTIEEVGKIAKKLNQNKAFRSFLERKQKKKKELLQKYLLQQIDFTEKGAFVEVSGSGMTQALLRGLIEEMGYPILPTYFMRVITTEFLKEQVWAYMPRFFYHGYLVEAFCRAVHGQTVGYEEMNGKIVPILDEIETESLKRYGYEAYIDGVCQFVQSFLQRLEEVNVSISVEKIYIRYFEYLSRIPDKEVLEFIGELPLEITGEKKEIIKLAPLLTEEEIEKIFLIRSYEPISRFYDGSNLECSIKRCSKEQQKKIEYYQLHANTPIGNMARKKYHDVLSPFLQKPSKMKGKVALYGAGRWGQKYYWRLQDTCDVEIVAWVDSEYRTYRKMGLEVNDISVLKGCFYDQILICVKNKLAVKEIWEQLLQMGVEKEKIWWIQDMYS